MNDLQVRSAKLEDIHTLRVFEQGVIEAERPLDETLKRTPIEYYDLEELITSEESEVVMVCAEGRPIGSGYAQIRSAKPYLDHEHMAYLGFMYTLPEYRGRGVNQLVIDHLCDWARSKSISEIRLEVYHNNDPALKAYEKVGFKKNLVEMRMRLDS